jgi:hypothetical protein
MGSSPSPWLRNSQGSDPMARHASPSAPPSRTSVFLFPKPATQLPRAKENASRGIMGLPNPQSLAEGFASSVQEAVRMIHRVRPGIIMPEGLVWALHRFSDATQDEDELISVAVPNVSSGRC